MTHCTSWQASALSPCCAVEHVLDNRIACVQDPERQKECEELLGPVGDDKFTYLKDVGRLITDFSQPDEEPGVPGDTLDDDIGVAVEFEGDEDADEESEVDEVEVCCSCDVCTMTLLNT